MWIQDLLISHPFVELPCWFLAVPATTATLTKAAEWSNKPQKKLKKAKTSDGDELKIKQSYDCGMTEGKGLNQRGRWMLRNVSVMGCGIWIVPWQRFLTKSWEYSFPFSLQEGLFYCLSGGKMCIHMLSQRPFPCPCEGCDKQIWTVSTRTDVK